ncbi:hypothetical protein BJ944DRAFT_291180 [Cunninghamella echinulata]|nr:hypothetical protein BJ944DRAFT_291180 [Cunninghamella echinulata]
MMSSDKSKLTHNTFLLATTILSVVSLIVALGGACALKVLQGAWWIVIYEVIVVAGHTMIFMRGTLANYRLAMLTFLAISIPLLTIQIDYILNYSKPNLINRVAANAYAVGYIGLVIIQYIWVLALGSEPTSYFGQLAQEELPSMQHHNQLNHHVSFEEPSQHHFYSEKTTTINSNNNLHSMDHSIQQDYSHINMPHAITTNDNSNNNTQPSSALLQPPTLNSTPSSSNISQNNTSPMISTDFKERVEAIHAYQANPQDPNELSFEKGEVVEIVDRKGNWWQARKADGTIGIIPSNYFRALQG